MWYLINLVVNIDNLFPFCVFSVILIEILQDILVDPTD